MTEVFTRTESRNLRKFENTRKKNSIIIKSLESYSVEAGTKIPNSCETIAKCFK